MLTFRSAGDDVECRRTLGRGPVVEILGVNQLLKLSRDFRIIEGGEYHALLGGAETIRRSRPVIVLEAGSRSTGQYGVSADDLYRLLTHDFGYRLTTLQRHAEGISPFTAAEFSNNWDHGPDYFFLAYPPESPIAPQPAV